jgi:hypothetical protein
LNSKPTSGLNFENTNCILTECEKWRKLSRFFFLNKWCSVFRSKPAVWISSHFGSFASWLYCGNNVTSVFLACFQ